MSIYSELNVIDDFEQRHGFDETLDRTLAFMISYLELMRAALPEPAQYALEVAKRHSKGAITPEDFEGARKALWKHLKKRHALADYETPENAIVHAAFALLTDHKDLKPGETISERVSNFLECANRLENHSGAVGSLLKFSY